MQTIQEKVNTFVEQLKAENRYISLQRTAGKYTIFYVNKKREVKHKSFKIKD